MRILVEVVDRPLNLRGPQYHVGERLILDDEKPSHREVLDAGWVRRLDPPLRRDPVAATAAIAAPPAHKMVDQAPTAKGEASRRLRKERTH